MIKKTPGFIDDIHQKTGYGYETDTENSDRNKIRVTNRKIIGGNNIFPPITSQIIKSGGISEHMISNGRVTDSSTIIEIDDKLDQDDDFIGPENQDEIEEATSFSNNNINNAIKGTTLYPVNDMLVNRFSKFARYGFLDPANENMGAREYLFFSKPDLHIFDNNGTVLNPELKSGFFNEAFNRYRYTLHCLQQDYGGAASLDNNIASISEAINLNNRFIPLLSNQVSSSLDLPTITASEITNNQNIYSINTSYREGSEISDCAYDFSLEFQDTKYLDTYMFFKIYDEYVRYKYKNDVSPNRKEYITCKINPELFSVWKIIVDDTNRIMFWAKAIGVAPMSVPRDTMSNFETNGIKFTVNMKAQFVRDMDSINLQELNHLTAQSLGLSVSSLNKSYIWRQLALPLSSPGNLTMADTRWGSYPFVVLDDRSPARPGQTDSISPNSSNHKFYRLVWLSDSNLDDLVTDPPEENNTDDDFAGATTEENSTT